MSRAANAPNPIPLDTASYPAADGTLLVTADDWFAACTSAFLRGLAVTASSSAPSPRRAPPSSPVPARPGRSVSEPDGR
jgi:hypothetical protein